MRVSSSTDYCSSGLRVPIVRRLPSQRVTITSLCSRCVACVQVLCAQQPGYCVGSSRAHGRLLIACPGRRSQLPVCELPCHDIVSPFFYQYIGRKWFYKNGPTESTYRYRCLLHRCRFTGHKLTSIGHFNRSPSLAKAHSKAPESRPNDTLRTEATTHHTVAPSVFIPSQAFNPQRLGVLPYMTLGTCAGSLGPLPLLYVYNWQSGTYATSAGM